MLASGFVTLGVTFGHVTTAERFACSGDLFDLFFGIGGGLSLGDGFGLGDGFTLLTPAC
jgi:hypothetical protein